MLAALTASAVGAMLAALLSVPLRSPDEAAFNSATVVVGALLAGLLAGVLWRLLGQSKGRLRRFQVATAIEFALTAMLLWAGESVLERTASFGIPLAAAVFTSIAAGTPLLAPHRLPMWIGGAAVAGALALGAALLPMRDAELAALTLPTSGAASTASTTPSRAAGASSATPAAGASTSPTAAPSASPTAAAGRFRTPADLRGVTFTVGEGSEGRFTVREQLSNLPLPNDATVRNTVIAGVIRLDGQPSTVEIDLRQFKSDQPRRDQAVARLWGRQPVATVTIDAIGALPERYTAGEVVRRQISGRLAILGAEGPISLDVEARLDGDRLALIGRTKFKWSDYRIPPPNIAGTVQVQDEVAVEVLLVARPTA